MDNPTVTEIQLIVRRPRQPAYSVAFGIDDYAWFESSKLDHAPLTAQIVKAARHAIEAVSDNDKEG